MYVGLLNILKTYKYTVQTLSVGLNVVWSVHIMEIEIYLH